jgi:hypothetical protein
VNDDNNDNVGSLSRKAEANRRNAQFSTGPKTEEGKSHSRGNSLKHGILASVIVIMKGEGAEDGAEFDGLLSSLQKDLAPVGALEEILVEKIATCCWRHRRALRCEAGLIRRAFLNDPRGLDEMINPQQAAIKDHLSLPLSGDLDRIIRYETSIQRQLVYAINQLERLQRVRKVEHVPAPVSVQLSSDQERDCLEPLLQKGRILYPQTQRR